ncbi:uncharacterized protein LOC132720848 [Ruditapes philippinarum]|uniref:uncharacterized protein LOC132720848 n=1 Tax=Ruditapes philippinarum TaxID=129788 RepID=UPI00295B2A66|nr:uncharacterized protein LOC132720848 [Ruditapes philippinarum]
MLFPFSICALVCAITVFGCNDIDTSACEQMFKQRPNFCSDQTIAKTACPAFCKLCPIECYHCNGTVLDTDHCKTVKTCPEGFVCMRKELKSIYDGHHEYELTCADKQECDHPLSAGVFGKRHVKPRDLTVTCCMEDRCNHLAPQTPKPISHCVKDLVLVVDDTSRIQPFENAVHSFLQNVVSSLPISTTDIHVALGMFSNDFLPIFDFNDHPSKADTLHAISTQVFRGDQRGDTKEALNYIINHALTPTSGDRPNAQNVVLLITSHDTGHDRELLWKENQVHMAADVILVQFGHADFKYLASGNNHNFHLSSGYQISQIAQNVTNLIMC